MTHSFRPTPETKRELRTAFGQFATGVTIVTVASNEGPIGITANSFASVSLDPPLLMWCPDKNSRRYAHFAKATHFAVHILSQDQGDLAMQVAKDSAALSAMALGQNDNGVPILGDCMARFDCRVHATHDAGDHVISVGEIIHVNMPQNADAQPLTFFNGAAGSFIPASKG